MQKPQQRMRWSVETRLEFIEFRLYWEGRLNRSDIVDQFGVSVPQASNDLSKYQDLAPANIRYDGSLKHYFATEQFKPVFLRPDADRYLGQLRAQAGGVHGPGETWLAQVPEFDTMPTLRRRVDPTILRTILDAMRRQRALEIHYQSLTRDAAMWRWITPHAFGSDGFRWHVRAFCHIDRIFKDFLLPRLLGARGDAEPRVSPRADKVWNGTVQVVLVPHPQLNADQRRVIAMDFDMDGESLKVQVRLALLYYFMKRLNLDGEPEHRLAKEQHIVVSNKGEVRAALKRAQEQSPIAA